MPDLPRAEPTLRRLLVLAAAGLAGAIAPAAAQTTAPPEKPAPRETGVWYDDTGDGAVEIYPCGKMLCGHIVWLRNPINDEGKPLRDKYNPDPALRTRPICGLPMLANLIPMTDGSWDRGTVYDPKKGSQHEAAIKLLRPDKLQLTGFGLGRLLSKSFIWTRAPADLPLCTAPKVAPNGGQAPDVPTNGAPGNIKAPAPSAPPPKSATAGVPQAAPSPAPAASAAKNAPPPATQPSPAAAPARPSTQAQKATAPVPAAQVAKPSAPLPESVPTAAARAANPGVVAQPPPAPAIAAQKPAAPSVQKALEPAAPKPAVAKAADTSADKMESNAPATQAATTANQMAPGALKKPLGKTAPSGVGAAPAAPGAIVQAGQASAQNAATANATPSPVSTLAPPASKPKRRTPSEQDAIGGLVTLPRP